MSFQDYSESIVSRLHIGKAKVSALIGVCALLFVVALFIVYTFAFAGPSFEVSKANANESQLEDINSDASKISLDKVCVDVTGSVNKPGVCYLDQGARVADAIVAAGGFAQGAATSSINQARLLMDGEQLYVYSIEEINSSPSNNAEATLTNGINNGKVNINTADSTTLQTISGIGQSKAEKIIAYRNANGFFASVDDLVNVSGIGEKTLESIRDSICV